jgi:hypothetical protein
MNHGSWDYIAHHHALWLKQPTFSDFGDMCLYENRVALNPLVYHQSIQHGMRGGWRYTPFSDTPTYHTGYTTSNPIEQSIEWLVPL